MHEAKKYLTINWCGDTKKQPLLLSFVLFVAAICIFCQVPFSILVGALAVEFMQQFTNILAWVDGASLNQFILVSVWHSRFQINIKILDLLP